MARSRSQAKARAERPAILALLLVVVALGAFATTLTAAVQAAPAKRLLPTGTDGLGVSAQISRRHVVFTFAASARGRFAVIAGRRVDVGCTILVRTAGTGYATSLARSTIRVRAPRRRRPFSAPLGRGRFDFCTIVMPGNAKHAAQELVAVPITERGATYLDALQTARNVLNVVPLVTVAHPPTEARLRKLTGGRVVALRLKAIIPPPGRVGYWTDGRGTVFVAQQTFYGALFFYEENMRTGLVVTDLLGWSSGQG